MREFIILRNQAMDLGSLSNMVLAGTITQVFQLQGSCSFHTLMPMTEEGMTKQILQSVPNEDGPAQDWPVRRSRSHIVKSSGLRKVCILPKISFSALSREAFRVQYFLDPTWVFSKKALMPWIHFNSQAPCPLEHFTFYRYSMLGWRDTSRFFQVN